MQAIQNGDISWIQLIDEHMRINEYGNNDTINTTLPATNAPLQFVRVIQSFGSFDFHQSEPM